VNSFPQIDISRTPWSEDAASAYYQFLLPGDPRPHGFMLPSVVAKMPWTSEWEVSKPDYRPRRVRFMASHIGQSIYCKTMNDALHRLVQAAIEAQTFQLLRHPLNEDMRIMGGTRIDVPSVPIKINRTAAPLFGIATRGAHMTVFVRRSPEEGGMKIWVPRRSAHLYTYPNMLDTTVAGGVKADESPFECIVHEADEEASLPEDLVRSRARACGAITYVAAKDTEDGKLMAPDCLYVYDLEVDEGVIPRPRDDEVKEFYLWDLAQVMEALVKGEFKPNCALVMIDFFIRHGVITEENNVDYLELCRRLRRKLPVPTSVNAGW
jgi:8-oxo-dGTP pyrophosphatase MutT (NUDIX family)